MSAAYSINRVAILTPTIWFVLFSAAIAQDAVPVEILNRTFLFKTENMPGATAFAIDYEGKLYIVTARHAVKGLPEKNATVQVFRANKWQTLRVLNILFPPSRAVDIAVFETDEKVAQPYSITSPRNAGGVTMGQQVWFLGYPDGLGSRFRNAEAPFIKRGTMSAIDATNEDATVLYIDGFNNPGFSGGPILYWSFSRHAYEILGVVMGYKFESAKVIVKGEAVDTQLLVNSGILLGYSIHHAIQAIEKSQEKRP